MDSQLIENSGTCTQTQPSCTTVKHSGFYIWQEDQWQLITTQDLQFKKQILDDAKIVRIYTSESEHVTASFILEPEPMCKLFTHAGSDRGFTWRANTEGPDKSLSVARFAIRFASPSKAVSFQKEYNRICVNN